MYEAVIGLEVHIHLKTKTKAFCGCSTEFGQEPNSQVCPVCLGFPGSLPVLNRVALDYAIKVALALHCQVQEYTKFDRKNYFYPDLPKNYQISQYDLPIGRNGYIEIDLAQGTRCINIQRVHLEEDAGKLIHKEDISLVDFNRAGIPLLEIVSEPAIYSAEEAHAYLTALKGIVEYLEVSDCDMEKGSLRCDANISLRKKGAQELGIKTELKNMNSFKAIKDALEYEIGRQKELLESAQAITGETRLWDSKSGQTFSMRSKEETKDYRYFPEPDLPVFIISQNKIEQLKKALPELPKEKRQRFIRDYGLSDYDARILVFNKKDAFFAEECLQAYVRPDKKALVNWLIGPLLAEANLRGCGISDLKVSAKDLVELVDYVERQEISYLSAKIVLEEMVKSGRSAGLIIHQKKLRQISDQDSLKLEIEKVIKENPKSVRDYQSGKDNALMFLVGQVMKKTAGKANPKVVHQILMRRLNNV